VLHYIAGKRLAAGRLTVVDATNVQPHARQSLVELARAHDVLPVAIVLDLPESVCAVRNAGRPDRDFGPHVIRRQRADLRRSIKGLRREGFRTVHVLGTEAEIAQASIRRTKMFSDLKDVSGPFDVIGDVHGCREELEALLARLGYALEGDGQGRAVNAGHPAGRRVIFLGDLVDRGPDTPGVLRLAMGMAAAGTALAVAGNHEVKLLRALQAGLGGGPAGASPPARPAAEAQQGRSIRVSHGLAQSLEQIGSQPVAFRMEAAKFLDSLMSHFVLDEGRLVVAHAGLAERLHGRASGRVREFCLYGQPTGETDEYGLPVRYPWAEDYRGRAMVLYGHTPALTAEWVNNTMCLDTGCVFGGALSALQYPERSVVSVPASRVYYEPVKPLGGHGGTGNPPMPGGHRGVGQTIPGGQAEPAAASRREPDVLDIRDVTGSRVIETGYLSRVSIRPENAAAALEVMSRFAIDPRWLVYLPPTMSPVATAPPGSLASEGTEGDSVRLPGGLLEHPDAAFSAFRDMGVGEVVCEEKHMGSRAVLLVCESPQAAQARFGVSGTPTASPPPTSATAGRFPVWRGCG
jgi:protein phosphatase